MARIMFPPLIAMTRVCIIIGFIVTLTTTRVWAQGPTRPETTQGMRRAEGPRAEATLQGQGPAGARTSPTASVDLPSGSFANPRTPGEKVNVPLPPSREVAPQPPDQIGAAIPPAKSPARSAPKPTGVISKVREKLVGKKSAKAAVAPLQSVQDEQDESDKEYDEVTDSVGLAVAGSPPPVAEQEQMFVGSGETVPANKPLVRTGEFSPLEQTVAKYQMTPAAAMKPTALSAEIQLSSRRLRDKFAAGDHDAVSHEASVIRTHVCSLRSMSSLSLEKRLKVTSICRMLEDGLQIIEEGQQTGDEAKVQLGLEKIYRASELLEPLDHGD